LNTGRGGRSLKHITERIETKKWKVWAEEPLSLKGISHFTVQGKEIEVSGKKVERVENERRFCHLADMEGTGGGAAEDQSTRTVGLGGKGGQTEPRQIWLGRF